MRSASYQQQPCDSRNGALHEELQQQVRRHRDLNEPYQAGAAGFADFSGRGAFSVRLWTGAAVTWEYPWRLAEKVFVNYEREVDLQARQDQCGLAAISNRRSVRWSSARSQSLCRFQFVDNDNAIRYA